MKRFRFTLDSVLRLKTQLELEARLREQSVRTELSKIGQKIHELEIQFDQAAHRMLANSLAPGKPVDQFLKDRFQLELLQEELDEANYLRAEFSVMLEQVRVARLESKKEVETLENLRESQWGVYRKQLTKRRDEELREFILQQQAVAEEVSGHA